MLLDNLCQWINHNGNQKKIDLRKYQNFQDKTQFLEIYRHKPVCGNKA